MRMTVKGQVTIPIEMREKLGLLPNSEVEFALVGRQRSDQKGKEQGRQEPRAAPARGDAAGAEAWDDDG